MHHAACKGSETHNNLLNNFDLMKILWNPPIPEIYLFYLVHIPGTYCVRV